MRREPKSTYVIGLLATAVLAVAVAGLAVYWVLLPPSVVSLAELEELPPKNLTEERASPGGTWKTTSYTVEEWGGELTEYVVVSSRDGSTEPRIVYAGMPAQVSWQGDSTVVIRRFKGGTERLDAATAVYEPEVLEWPRHRMLMAVLVLLPAAVVAGVGVVATVILARVLPRRRAK